jgi:hypothetical protein
MILNQKWQMGLDFNMKNGVSILQNCLQQNRRGEGGYKTEAEHIVVASAWSLVRDTL